MKKSCIIVIAIVLLILSSNAYATDYFFEYGYTSGTNYNWISAGATGGFGAEMVSNFTNNTCRIELELERDGTVTGDLWVSIFENGITDTPLGYTNNVSASTVSTSKEWVNFTFESPVNLINGNTYYIRGQSGDDTTGTGIHLYFHHNSGTGHDTFTFDGSSWNSYTNDGEINVKLYSCTVPGPVDIYNQSTDTVIELKVDNPVVINSNIYTNVYSANFTAENSSGGYITATIESVMNLDRDQYCRILVDGKEYGTEDTRTMTAGQVGSIYIMSQEFNVTQGEDYQIDLQCRREGVGGKLTINKSNILIHLLYDARGFEINKVVDNSTLSINSDSFYSLYDAQFNTSGVDSGEYERMLIIDGQITYEYTSSSEIQLYLEVNGNMSPIVIRNGGAGTTGSGGTFFIHKGIDANSTVNYSIYGKSSSGDGGIKFKSAVKEIILDVNGSNKANMSGINTSSTTWSTVETMQINNSNNPTGDLVVKSAISSNGTVAGDIWYRFKVGTDYSTEIKRELSSSNGVIILQELFTDIGLGEKSVEMQVKVSAGVGYITGGTTDAYIINEIIETINSYNVSVNNTWNGSTINSFYVMNEYNTTFNATNGIAEITATNEFDNLTIKKDGYISRTVYNQSTTQNLNASIYQTVVVLGVTEISTNEQINSFKLETVNGNSSSTDGTVTLYPNYGNYEWGVYFEQYYFNSTNRTVTIDEQYEYINITEFYARNITFHDNITYKSIEPECVIDGYTYSKEPYYIHKFEGEMNCSVFKYENTSFTLNNTYVDTNSYMMYPNTLILYFTTNTSGVIETEQCVEVNDCTEFNDSVLSVPARNMSIGYVRIKFNPDGTGWNQYFSFYNDGNESIRESLQVETTDLQKEFIVSGDGEPLENVRVCASGLGIDPQTNETDWIVTYCDYTNEEGIVIIKVDDGDTYRFVMQKEGYITESNTYVIAELNTDTIKVDMQTEADVGGFTSIVTNCPNVVNEGISCNLKVITYKIYSSVCTELYYNGAYNDTSCLYNTIGGNFLYNMNELGKYRLFVNLSGTNVRIIEHNYTEWNASKQIDFELEKNGVSLVNKVGETREMLITFYIISIIVGVIMGFAVEKYFVGHGVLGMVAWFIVIGSVGFTVFYIPALIILMYYVVNNVLKQVKA